MTDNLGYSPRTGAPPQSAFVTACEALTWIVWGEARTVDRIQEDGFAAVLRWGTSELGLLHEALIGRTSPQPYCLALRQPSGFGSVVTSADLRRIRAKARRQSGKLVSFADLARQLADEINKNRTSQRLLDQANADLLEMLRAEKLSAFGQQRQSDGKPNPGARHSEIPIDVLIHPMLTIELWNQLTIDNAASATAWNARRSLAFDDVRFRSADILRLWPPHKLSLGGEALPPELASDPLAVRAFDDMIRRSESGIQKRDTLARDVSKETGYPVRKARLLFKYLPENLRNPARQRPRL